jgi:hypothetical protein
VLFVSGTLRVLARVVVLARAECLALGTLCIVAAAAGPPQATGLTAASADISGGAKPCVYADLMPEYQRFADSTVSLAPQERAAAFTKEIVPRFPDYYATEVYGDQAKLQARAARFFDPAWRASVSEAPLTDEQLKKMGLVIGPEFLRQQRKFIAMFRDFRCSATVEFGVSLMKFDGHPVEFGGKQHLLFGVDMIAALHGTEDMPAFFDHEIFHLYQKQVMEPRPRDADDPAWLTMWTEGLATYVSHRMNPQLEAQQVLWFPRDMVARMRIEAPRAAQLLLRDLDKTGPEADRWFLMGTQVEGLPDRAGYYLGFLFSKSVGDGVELPKLARGPLAEVHQKERTFLSELAGRVTPSPKGSAVERDGIEGDAVSGIARRR